MTNFIVQYKEREFKLRCKENVPDCLHTSDVEKLLRLVLSDHSATFVMGITDTSVCAQDECTLFGEADVDQHVGVVGAKPFCGYVIFPPVNNEIQFR